MAGTNSVAGGKIQRVYTTSNVNGLDNGRLYTGGLLRILPLSFLLHEYGEVFVVEVTFTQPQPDPTFYVDLDWEHGVQ